MKDYYAIMGVGKDATPDEIKKAYRRLARKYHPDVSTEADAEARFKEVGEAYATLSDPEKRAQYDNPNRNPFGGNGFRQYTYNTSNINEDEILEILRRMNIDMHGVDPGEIFGRRRKQQNIAHIRITLEEAFTGTTRTLNNKKFNVPKGVRSGNKLAVDDFIIVVEVGMHPRFRRANDDLIATVQITAFEAITGIDCEVTLLDGSVGTFSVPPGTQNGQIIRIRGKGMPNPELNFVGDLLVQVAVTLPDNLTQEQITRILNEFPNRKTISI